MLFSVPYEVPENKAKKKATGTVPENKAKKKATGTRKSSRRLVVSDSSPNDPDAPSAPEDEEEGCPNWGG